MKLMVTAQIGDRQIVEIAENIPETRQGWRDVMNEMGCRIELSTFGPPGPVAEMTAEDKPYSFQQQNPKQ